MRIIAAIVALTAIFFHLSAETYVKTIGQPLTSVDQIVDGNRYMLRNTGRNRWIAEDGYAALTFRTAPTPGPDASNDYLFTIHRTSDGLFSFRTRRGRFIPEVDNATPLTVGSASRAGLFTISPKGEGTFTIINSVDTRYGFDGTASAFVGWNAGQGSNCAYEIIPVEMVDGHYPLGEYTEPDGGETPDAAAWDRLESDDLYLTWASKDVQYARRDVPAVRMTADTTVYAWRGERVGVQAIAFSRGGEEDLAVALGPWRNASGASDTEALPADASTTSWTRFVITEDNRTCGDHGEMPVHTVPDVIDILGSSADIEPSGVRPIWCTIEVPRTLAPGKYTAELTISRAGSSTPLRSITLNLIVDSHTLPEVADQAFYLDFWQQPYAVSRYYGVERWSDEHLDALRPYMQMLARAGQKVVTAVLFHEPWGRQSYDKFDPMVETTLRADGTWAFDFTIFDRWVEFMDGCGINARINCYSMVPWDMKFRYIDEATDTYRYLSTQTSSDDYRCLWMAFLTEFASHLRARGWFEKTAIGMDERGLSAMRDAIAIVSDAAPGLRVALAGNYHAEISADLDDYSVAYAGRFPEAELARRRAAGQTSTSYVCCADPGANIFTNNAPSDASYIPIQAIAAGLDGILHWSWINWPEDPLLDSRLHLQGVDAYTFAPGDTYSIYPGPRSSVRFERLIEGIQQTEKIRILRQEWEAAGNDSALNALNAAIQPFVAGTTDFYNTTATMVNTLESILNGSPLPAPEPLTEYCPISLSGSKKDIALEKRFITEARSEGCNVDIDYASDSPSATGVVTAPKGITVAPGSSFSLNVKVARNDDDLTYCRMIAGADWDGNFFFDPAAGEVLDVLGKTYSQNLELADQTLTFTVPADARPGESILRLVYQDAWAGSDPALCGETLKGFVFDIPMTIQPSGSGISQVAPIDNRISWYGSTMIADEPVNIKVYSTSGALLDALNATVTYTLDTFTPGIYIIAITHPDGSRTTHTRRR